MREEHDGVETRFVYDGNNLLRETDDTNLPEADYTYIPQAYAEAISQRRDGDSSFYLADGIKNVRKLTDDAGLVTDEYAYDAFGGARPSTGSTTNSQQYKGQLLGYRRDPHAGPDTDYSAHHRNYNPKTGRFRSEDPAADDLNLYRYVNNDPANRQDPSGLLDPQKLKESLATYDPLALEWLEERGVDLVAYTPTNWESVWGWEPSVKVGDEDDPIRYQVRLDANRSNWSAFLEITQRVRKQEGYREWKAAWMARHGIPDKREQILQPAPGSPEAVTFWRKIAKEEHRELIRLMREVGATEDEISSEEWRPFYNELLRPGGTFEQIVAVAGAARVARAGIKGSSVRPAATTIEPASRAQIVPVVPPGPFKAPVNRPELGQHVKDVIADPARLITNEGVPSSRMGSGGAVSIYGEGEAAKAGFPDFATELTYARGRPLTSALPNGSLSDIALRDVRLSSATLSEMQRLAQPGARITYANADVEGFAAYVKQLQKAFPNATILHQGTVSGANGARGVVVLQLPQ